MARLDHVTLAVADWRVSRDWWTGHLGFEVEFEIPNGVAIRDEADLTVFLEQRPHVPSAEGVTLTVQVDDVEARHRAMSAAGVGFAHPPQKVFWGYGAEALDPDGYRIRLWDKGSMDAKGAA
jgi:catechol 2,3-dioxygenase-like lactoylglutathione lyase family enzyme